MHAMPNYEVLERESRHESNAKQQQAAMFVSNPKETCSFTSFKASVSNLNHQIFTYFVYRRSFLSSCYHFNLKQAFKVNNLVPMTKHHGRCHWSRALCQVSGRACSCKKDSCSEEVHKRRRNFLSLSELGYGSLEFNFRRVHLHLTIKS